MNMPPCALGIDLGSTTAKIVAVDETGRMLWHLLEQAEPRPEVQAGRFLETARQALGILDGVPIVATGYGRRLVHAAHRQVTEIACHARGIFHAFGHGGTLVDIGGQDSKVIAISPQGRVIDFAMNDKCSAGTGRFLENSAGMLRVPLDRLGDDALSAGDEISISNTCTVFAETEVISLLANGTPLGSILRGLHRALVRRIVALIYTVGLNPPLMLSGGVAHNPAVRHMLEQETREKVILPPHPQLVGALGAALLALELKGNAK
jgi:predicted CoA-substrate-specific enzyme activase